MHICTHILLMEWEERGGRKRARVFQTKMEPTQIAPYIKTPVTKVFS